MSEMADWKLITDSARMSIWYHQPTRAKVILDKLTPGRYQWTAPLADGRLANSIAPDLVNAQAQALVHADLSAEQAAKL